MGRLSAGSGRRGRSRRGVARGGGQGWAGVVHCISDFVSTFTCGSPEDGSTLLLPRNRVPASYPSGIYQATHGRPPQPAMRRSGRRRTVTRTPPMWATQRARPCRHCKPTTACLRGQQNNITSCDFRNTHFVDEYMHPRVVLTAGRKAAGWRKWASGAGLGSAGPCNLAGRPALGSSFLKSTRARAPRRGHARAQPGQAHPPPGQFQVTFTPLRRTLPSLPLPPTDHEYSPLR